MSDHPKADTTRPDSAPVPVPGTASPPGDSAIRQDRPSLWAEAGRAAVGTMERTLSDSALATRRSCGSHIGIKSGNLQRFTHLLHTVRPEPNPTLTRSVSFDVAPFLTELIV
jgi:hypothetical protein